MGGAGADRRGRADLHPNRLHPPLHQRVREGNTRGQGGGGDRMMLAEGHAKPLGGRGAEWSGEECRGWACDMQGCAG